jgi:single-stranded-DNA-specific exonuclease
VTFKQSKSCDIEVTMQPQNRKRWVVAQKIHQAASDALSAYPPVLKQLLFNRGIVDSSSAIRYLTAEGSLHDPFLLTDMRTVVDRIWAAVDRLEPIAVYGDYDVDGVTATALMVQVLRTVGADVRGYIPNRFEEGYGLNIEAIDQLNAQGVKLIITVDCGIRSPAEAEHSRKAGVDMIISDHHEPKLDLPQAVGVICPKRAGDVYPEKNLAGVGLAFKICQALLQDRPQAGVDVQDWLDLVAVGTVADIVPLVDENRALVRAGLTRLRNCRRRGLISLTNAAELQLPNLTARDIGFAIGPRLNAAGRIESALAAYDLLMSEDSTAAGLLAQKLDDQNRHRQTITAEMQAQADLNSDQFGRDHIIFAFDSSFNMGIVGLVASRLTEMYYRPSIVGYQGEEFTRASCRSIPEFNITQALDQCTDLLVRHGGHAMAAGFTVSNQNLPALVERLRKIAKTELGDREDLCPTLHADMEIPLSELQAAILRYIDQIEPTGLGNPGALFVTRGLKVVRHRTVGKESNHLKLTVSDGKLFFDGIAFRQGHWAANMPDKVDLLYAFEVNVYQGRPSFQLNIRDIKPTEE